MNDTPTLASAPHRASWPGTPNLAISRSIIATWSERIRVRWELEQMSKDDPHLIDDIGVTRRQVEAEIVKPFWQV
jgi:uncharacterized protein YjiS (DUF1127 family)